MQDNDTNQDIADGESDETGETTLSSDIEEVDLDHQQEVLLLDKACPDTSSESPRVPLPKIRCHADTVIGRTLVSHPRKPPGSIASPLLKRHKSALLNKSSESDCSPSA